MFCKNCGKEIPENSLHCQFCGNPVSDNNTYQVPANNDTGSVGWFCLGCTIPIAGLVLYFVWRDEKPKDAKKCITGFLTYIIASIVILVLYFLIYFIIFMFIFTFMIESSI